MEEPGGAGLTGSRAPPAETEVQRSCGFKMSVTHLSLPQVTTVGLRDPSSNLSIFILNMVSFLSLIRLLSSCINKC